MAVALLLTEVIIIPAIAAANAEEVARSIS